jgi:hypothetical protein
MTQNTYQETELSAFLIVNSITFKAVTNVRAWTTLDNEYKGLILDQDIDEDPIFFADEAIARNISKANTNKELVLIQPNFKIMELSLDAVTRSMQLKYLKLKALECLVRDTEKEIRDIGNSLHSDLAHVYDKYSPEHRVELDDSLLNFKDNVISVN